MNNQGEVCRGKMFYRVILAALLVSLFSSQPALVQRDRSIPGQKLSGLSADGVESSWHRKALHDGGRVVYLHASVEQQVGRTARDRNRPLLRTADPAKTLRDLLAIRDPLYREIADLVVETDERPPRMVVLDILDRLAQLPPR